MLLKKHRAIRLTPRRTVVLLTSAFGVSLGTTMALAAAEGEVTPWAVRAGLWDAIFSTGIIAIVVAGLIAGRMTRRTPAG